MSDLISRKAAIDALADYIHNMDKVMGTGHLTADDCKDAAASVFEELPSAQPERKKGKWILVHEADETGNATYECSICHRGEIHVPIVEVGYCWHCGADMRGE